MGKIVLILWIQGAGFHLGYTDSWTDCQGAVDALERLGVETSCHLNPEGEPDG